MTERPPAAARATLTAALIVRNEAANIGGCLSSLAGVVDEIVVVDTGSTDDTVAQARALGGRVIEAEWHDDFAAARNVALDRATGDWILYVDADERLVPVDRHDLDRALSDPRFIAYRVLLRPFPGSTLCREYRLWRNDRRIRFEGVIHEKIVPSLKAAAAEDGSSIGRCDLTIEHLGYDGDQTHKHLRNLPLLHAALAREPRNIFNWHHLARVHAALGHGEECDAALARALDVIRDTVDPAPIGALVFGELIDRARGTARARELVHEALTTYPQDPVLVWIRAAMAIDDGEPALALHWLDRLLDPEGFSLDDSMSYDQRLFGAWPHGARGLCLFHLGRHAEAATAYRAAEACDPGDVESRAKRQLCEQLARRSPERWQRCVDVAGVTVALSAREGYHARALDAATETLPSVADDREADAWIDVDIGIDAPAVEWQHADGDVRASWSSAGLELAHGAVRARVDDYGASITGDADLVRAVRQLLPYALTHLLTAHDRFVLHGGVILRGGKAVLVLGPTGSGKSTLAAWATRAGWTVGGDDLVVVRAHDDHVVARAIPKPILVPHAVCERLRLPGAPVDGDPRGRWRLDGVQGAGGWTPVVGTLVSAGGTARTARTQGLAGRELFQWLLFSFLAARDESRLEAFLPVAATLSQRGGAAVAHGARHHKLEKVIDRAIREFRAAPA